MVKGIDCYKCTGDRAVGEGRTIEQAYENWKLMRFMPNHMLAKHYLDSINTNVSVY